MRDLTKRLRAASWDTLGWDTIDDATEAADILDAIDALHVLESQDDSAWWCSCGAEWPCPTHRVLHPDG